MPPPTQDTTGIEYYTIPDFTFASGTTLHDVKIAYRSLNPSSTSGAVLIPTCFAGLINSTLTFSQGPHAALSKYHVIIVAMFGNGESASPSTKPFFPSPSSLHYRDLIHAQHALLSTHLHIDSLEAVLGFSMAGQQAYHWGVMYPSYVRRIIPICSSARTSPHNYAFLEGPVTAMVHSIDYIAWKAMKGKIAAGEDVGENMRGVVPKRGLKAFARAYAAWLTSAAWFRDREWAKGEMGFASVEEWLGAREEGYVGWDADDLLVLARMWQMGDIGTVIPGEETVGELGGSVADDERYRRALEGIQAKVLLMPCRTDQYFPPEDSEIEIQYLKHGTLKVIESTWGHIAGGGANPTDVEFMDRQIAEFMKT